MINHYLNFGEQAIFLFLLLFPSLSCMVSHSLPHIPPHIACKFSPQMVCQCFPQLEIAAWQGVTAVSIKMKVVWYVTLCTK